MTKFAHRVAIAAIAIFCLSVGSAQAQKIGIVDVGSVITAMPEYQAALQKAQAQQKIYTDSLQAMKIAFQAAQDTYAKLGENATADFKKKEQDDLSAKQAAYEQYYEATLGQNGSLAQLQNQLLQPIQEKVKAALASYAKKERISVIIPASAAVYFDPTLDYTAKFQDFLKAQASK